MVTASGTVYPEFHGLSIEWKPIIITVPEPYIQQVETILNVPEFTMVENTIILTLPEFTLRNIEAAAAEMQADGKELAENTQANIKSSPNLSVN